MSSKSGKMPKQSKKKPSHAKASVLQVGDEVLGLDALCEKFALSCQKRLELLGELLERVKKEALDRDLSSTSTHKVIELVVKLSDAVKEKGPQVQFQKEETRTLVDNLKKLNSGRVIDSWEG
jgi:hypothetical protein